MEREHVPCEGEKMKCYCPDWEPETTKLSGPIVLAQARDRRLTVTPAFQFKPWQFCPWCGRNIEATERKMSRMASEMESKEIWDSQK
jgi:hypothetical protein